MPRAESLRVKVLDRGAKVSLIQAGGMGSKMASFSGSYG